jgi:TP901-1 family phage major tail protein
MSAQSGSLMLLKVYNKQTQKYDVVGGMKNTKFLLNNQLVDISTKESGKWRYLLSGVGTSYVSISGSGIFTNKESEHILRGAAFDNTSLLLQISFANGDLLSGSFVINVYERIGNFAEEEIYNLGLESSGIISYLHNNVN